MAKTILFVILALLAFGILILVHEGGHFAFARIFKVTVNEFSIGMGPKLFSKKDRHGTAFSLRALPIGGFVSMAGEDEDSDDPNAFNLKPVWQRFLIIFAGAATNLILGFIVVAILVVFSQAIGSTVVADFNENAASAKCGLAVGDEIVKVEGTSVHTSDELVYEIMRYGIEPVDLTVERNGERIVIEDIEFPQMSESGIAFGDLDFFVYAEQKTVGNILKQSFYRCEFLVRQVWESLYDLVRGRFGIEAVSGPIGATKELTKAAESGAYPFTYLVTILCINLGVMNLLPFPALDGGKLVLLIVEAIIRKPINRKIEGIINFGGLAILLLFMMFICVKDVMGLF